MLSMFHRHVIELLGKEEPSQVSGGVPFPRRFIHMVEGMMNLVQRGDGEEENAEYKICGRENPADRDGHIKMRCQYQESPIVEDAGTKCPSMLDRNSVFGTPQSLQC